MVDLAAIQTAYYMVAATGVLVAAIYYIITLRNTNKTRQAQLYYGIWQNQRTKEAWKAMHDWDIQVKDYDEWEKLRENRDMKNSWSMNMSLYEGIAVFVREGLIDIRLLARDMGGNYVYWWRQWEPIIKEYRVRHNFPRYMIEAE